MFTPILTTPHFLLLEQVTKLESELALTMGMLQTVVEKLEQKFGREFLGADLSRFVDAGKGPDVQATVELIDQLVRDGVKPEAARHFRAACGVTWDQAHAAIRDWSDLSREKHLRQVWLAQCLAALKAR